MKKLFLLAAFSVLFISTSITAQQKRTITLNEAIQLALENNYQLKQAGNNLELAEYSITNEKADFLPNLSASSDLSRRYGRNFNNTTGQVQNFANTSASFGIRSSLPIFTGFENINSLRRSEQNKISQEEELRRVRESIIFNTASRFLQVLLDKELLEIAKENLKTSNQQLEQVKAQVEVGSRPSVDLFNQESQVANNELTVTQRENALSNNKLLLVRQMQVDPLNEYEFKTPEIDKQELSLKTINARDLVQSALVNRADVRSAEANINSLELANKIAKGNLLPTLSLSGSWGTGYDESSKKAGIGFNDQVFDQNISKNIGLNLSIPLFNNLDRSYNIESAQVQYKNAVLGLENVKLQVIQEVTQAKNDYTSTIKQLEAAEKAYSASEKAFETQQERYNVGASTLIELSQAQANFVQAQSDRTQALYNLIFQEKLLDYYVGKLSGSDISFN